MIQNEGFPQGPDEIAFVVERALEGHSPPRLHRDPSRAVTERGCSRCDPESGDRQQQEQADGDLQPHSRCSRISFHESTRRMLTWASVAIGTVEAVALMSA